MPSGPKKRRAARKKNDGDASFTHPAADVKVDADAKLSEILSTVSELSTVNVHVEAKPDISLKENEGKEFKSVAEQTFFENSAIEQSMVNQNLTKCSQMSFVQPFAEPVVHSDAADSSFESVKKEANGAFDKQLESGFKEPAAPPIDISGDKKDQAKAEMALLELLLQSAEGHMLAQKHMEVYQKWVEFSMKFWTDELKSQKQT